MRLRCIRYYSLFILRAISNTIIPCEDKKDNFGMSYLVLHTLTNRPSKQFHCSSTWSPPQMKRFTCRVSRFSAPSWHQRVSCITSHSAISVFTAPSYWNQWPPRLCVSAPNRQPERLVTYYPSILPVTKLYATYFVTGSLNTLKATLHLKYI